jgi:CBS domain-containing protein
VYASLPEGSEERRQRLYPVLDDSGRLVGVLPWSAVLAGRTAPEKPVGEYMVGTFLRAYPDDVLRSVADRMAAAGIGVLPVVEREDQDRLLGVVSQFDLLGARQKLLEEERNAERVLLVRRLRQASARREVT